jgi:hypothetical protein
VCPAFSNRLDVVVKGSWNTAEVRLQGVYTHNPVSASPSPSAMLFVWLICQK